MSGCLENDSVVGKTLAAPELTREPTASEEGELLAPVEVEFNVNNGDIQGVAYVVYGGYPDGAELRWKILKGADTEGVPTDLVEVRGNSSSAGPKEFLDPVPIPKRDPSDPSTHFLTYQPVIVPIGPTQTTVPLTPEGAKFYVPAPSP